MYLEHDLAVLMDDLPAHGLHAGDVGTIVHIHGKGEGFEVEFSDIRGGTIAVVTLRPAAIRPLQPGERPVPHLQST